MTAARLTLVAAAAVAVGACGAKERRSDEPARRDGGDAAIVTAAADAAPVTPPGTVAPYRLAPGGADGGVAGGAALKVTVQWPDAPAAVRASPGRDRCGAPRPPFVRVHTLHGVADVVVWIDDIAAGKPAPAPAPATLAVRDCRLGPAVQVAPRADAELRLRDLDERPATVEVAWAARPGDEPVVVARAALPVVGHEVAVPLRPWATRLTSDATGDDAAWVITPPTPYVAVTDDAGAAVLTDVPAGTYRVRAWLRPGAGQAAREAAGEVTIAAGADATLTLSLADAAGPADDASATGAAADDDDDDDP